MSNSKESNREFGTSCWVVDGGTMYCKHCAETTKARKWRVYIKCHFCPDCGFEMSEETVDGKGQVKGK